MKTLSAVLIISTLISCSTSEPQKRPEHKVYTSQKSEEIQKAIIEEHLTNGAKKLGLYSQARQEELDKGLAKDSTIAVLWQQKAMPLFKQGKYELGMYYIDKAVKFDRGRYQDYRAFIKCIFAKTYQAAIVDFNDYKAQFGNGYVMDHSYDFYIALSKIQLNEFADAERILQKETERQKRENGEKWVHYLDLFYLGIAKFEQKKTDEALPVFEQALALYPQFSEAIYYKAGCLARQGKQDEAKELILEAKKYGLAGYSVNEDNAIYERYPYQVRWELWDR